MFYTKNFPIENVRVQSNLQKSSVFHGFPCLYPQKKYWARVPKILMPHTFPIAGLNRYTPNLRLFYVLFFFFFF